MRQRWLTCGKSSEHIVVAVLVVADHGYFVYHPVQLFFSSRLYAPLKCRDDHAGLQRRYGSARRCLNTVVGASGLKGRRVLAVVCVVVGLVMVVMKLGGAKVGD